MFGFLKPLLRKLVETPVETEPPPAPDFAPQSFAPAPPAGYPRPARPGRPPQHAVHPQPGRLQPGRTNGKGLELPLQSVLQILPLELQPRVLYPEVGDATISVPLEKILAQLSRGTVKISFGELRMAAPGVFSPENDRDRVLVPLPLEEILVRLNPALITRRRTQRQVEVPMDISSPFDMDGQGLAFSTGPGASSKPEPAPMAAPTARHAPPPAPRQTAPPPPPQHHYIITGTQNGNYTFGEIGSMGTLSGNSSSTYSVHDQPDYTVSGWYTFGAALRQRAYFW